MADKGSTWFSGVEGMPRPQSTVQADRLPSSPSGNGGMVRTMLIVGAVSAGSALALIAMPVSLLWQSMRVAGVGIVLLFLFVWACGPTRRPKTAFVIWWLVLVSGCIFFRQGDLS